VELTTEVLSFRVNAANVAVHKRDYSFSVPLVEIANLDYKRGFITGILSISTRQDLFRLRCFRAKRFGEAIARARSAALTANRRDSSVPPIHERRR
jgi:hypothetical protein